MNIYLYQNNHKALKFASSGGAFMKMLETFKSSYDSCYVYGATWNNLEVIHSRIKGEDDLIPFSGSKYTRSKMGDGFKNVSDDLNAGNSVMFSGTPCQVKGLINYLTVKNINMDKLVTIDIICHGTPSPKLLKEWIHGLEKKYNDKIILIRFRDKSIGWKFMRLFFSNLILGESCYECHFSNMNRPSDITIGDFWGAENILANSQCKKGVSLILTNTEKGENILKLIKSTVTKEEKLKEIEDDRCLDYQLNLHCPTKKPENYSSFWGDYKMNGYDYIIKKYRISSKYLKMRFWVRQKLIKMGILKQN